MGNEQLTHNSLNTWLEVSLTLRVPSYSVGSVWKLQGLRVDDRGGITPYLGALVIGRGIYGLGIPQAATDEQSVLILPP